MLLNSPKIKVWLAGIVRPDLNEEQPNASGINSMISEGWELAFVTSAVESKGSSDDNAGIFITRYIFKRQL